MFFSRFYPACTVACVEPVPNNINLLRMNLEINHLSVRVFPSAVGAIDGNAMMNVSPDPRSNSILRNPNTASMLEQMVPVKVLSVPSLLSALNWSKVDLIKIDIEGGEVEVLGGRPDWLNRVGAILGEGHHGSGYTIASARSDLEPFGFTVNLIEQRQGSFLFFAKRTTA